MWVKHEAHTTSHASVAMQTVGARKAHVHANVVLLKNKMDQVSRIHA
jgi:hypothetical protein